VTETAEEGDLPLVRVQGDLEQWFNMIVRAVVDATMGEKGLPERWRELLMELYTRQRCVVRTRWGLTEGVIRGEVGAGQGSVSASLMSLWAQEAATWAATEVSKRTGAPVGEILIGCRHTVMIGCCVPVDGRRLWRQWRR